MALRPRADRVSASRLGRHTRVALVHRPSRLARSAGATHLIVHTLRRPPTACSCTRRWPEVYGFDYKVGWHTRTQRARRGRTARVLPVCTGEPGALLLNGFLFLIIMRHTHRGVAHRGAAGYGISLRAHGHARAHRGTRYAHGVRGVCPVPARWPLRALWKYWGLFHTQRCLEFFYIKKAKRHLTSQRGGARGGTNAHAGRLDTRIRRWALRTQPCQTADLPYKVRSIYSLADASWPPVATAAPCGVGKLALADSEYVVAHCMQKSASAGLRRTRSYRCAGSSAP